MRFSVTDGFAGSPTEYNGSLVLTTGEPPRFIPFDHDGIADGEHGLWHIDGDNPQGELWFELWETAHQTRTITHTTGESGQYQWARFELPQLHLNFAGSGVLTVTQWWGVGENFTADGITLTWTGEGEVQGDPFTCTLDSPTTVVTIAIDPLPDGSEFGLEYTFEPLEPVAPITVPEVTTKTHVISYSLSEATISETWEISQAARLEITTAGTGTGVFELTGGWGSGNVYLAGTPWPQECDDQFCYLETGEIPVNEGDVLVWTMDGLVGGTINLSYRYHAEEPLEHKLYFPLVFKYP
jgi:hypothetical protein